MTKNYLGLFRKTNYLIKKRNRELVQEAVLGISTYRELGKKYGISQTRVEQILHKFGIKCPMVKGSGKHKKFLERQRIAKICR